MNLKEALEARLAEAQGRVRGLEEALKVLKELNIGLSTLPPVSPLPPAEQPNSVPPPNIPADMLVAQQQIMQPSSQQQSGHMPPYLAAKARRIQEGKK